MSSAKVPDPSFTWRSHERWTWRSIGLLLAITAGGGFFVGRLSIAVPAEQPTGSKAEQQTASAGSVTQRQAALQSDVSAAPIHSSANKETKPETKDGPIEGSTASSMETPKRQSTTAIEKGASNSPVALVPSSAEKAADGGASKQPMFKTGLEAAAKANKKTKPHKAADDGSPAATATQRQAETRARSSASEAPARRDSVVVRRDDAYVPPRLPQAAYADQRGRYDNAEGDDDDPRLGQLYLDRRYAEDAPPPHTYYEYRREYRRPFQDPRDFRDHRRFGGYDHDPYADRRPMLLPMYGGPAY